MWQTHDGTFRDYESRLQAEINEHFMQYLTARGRHNATVIMKKQVKDTWRLDPAVNRQAESHWARKSTWRRGERVCVAALLGPAGMGATTDITC